MVVDKLIDKEEILTIDSEFIKKPRYYQIWKNVYETSKIFQLRYLYILQHTKEGQFLFLLDTGAHPYIDIEFDSNQKPFPYYYDYTPEEIKRIPIEQEYPSIYDELIEKNLLKIYEDAPQAAYKAFESESIQYEEYTDKYGTFKSAFYPMYYNGKKVGLFGADFEITYIRSLERKAQLNLLAAIIAGLLMTIIVRYLINKTIVSKILTLNENSKKIAQGNFDVHIDIKQKDELGELASTFNSMAQSLKESFLKIKEYNEQLEEKVRQRTKELSETLDKVQELKKQQDGDYFLTSLLLNPLMQNRTRSQKVSIQFFVDQKKKFTFRNKEHAIGGDVCISGDLLLKGKRY
ncbi:MAG: HAMP domain-containing protein, partial [Leptospiraceae bacterium]|nr:HAMP domain-containing protein [Leptospiraceae bacterium]